MTALVEAHRRAAGAGGAHCVLIAGRRVDTWSRGRACEQTTAAAGPHESGSRPTSWSRLRRGLPSPPMISAAPHARPGAPAPRCLWARPSPLLGALAARGRVLGRRCDSTLAHDRAGALDRRRSTRRGAVIPSVWGLWLGLRRRWRRVRLQLLSTSRRPGASRSAAVRQSSRSSSNLVAAAVASTLAASPHARRGGRAPAGGGDLAADLARILACGIARSPTRCRPPACASTPRWACAAPRLSLEKAPPAHGVRRAARPRPTGRGLLVVPDEVGGPLSPSCASASCRRSGALGPRSTRRVQAE